MVQIELGDKDIPAGGKALSMGTFYKTDGTLQTISRSGSGTLTGISGVARITTAGTVTVTSALYVEIKPTLDGVLSGTTQHYIVQYESGDTNRKDFIRFFIPLQGRYLSTASITLQLFGAIGVELATVLVIADVFENRTS